MSSVEPPGARKMPVNCIRVSREPLTGSPELCPALGSEAAGAGLVQPDNSWVWGSVTQQPPVPVGRLLTRWRWALLGGRRTSDSRPKLEERRLCLDIRKSFFPSKAIGPGNWLYVKLSRLHPWRLSRTKWINLEQSGLTSWLTLLQAGIDCIKDLLRSLIMLYSYVIVQKY